MRYDAAWPGELRKGPPPNGPFGFSAASKVGMQRSWWRGERVGCMQHDWMSGVAQVRIDRFSGHFG